MKKKLIALVLVLVMVSAAIALVACDAQAPAVSEDTSFILEVRKYNGADSMGNVKIDGELICAKEILVKKGQVTVSEALNEVAPAVDGVHKVKLNDTDYLIFTESSLDGYTTSWMLTDGHLDREPNYVAADYSWSYMAYNGHYSNGVTVDFLDGLTLYTIVIDGWDGHIGE